MGLVRGLRLDRKTFAVACLASSILKALGVRTEDLVHVCLEHIGSINR